MNVLDYVLQFSIDDQGGGTIRTRNHGRLKLMWPDLSEYANRNKSDLRSRLEKSITAEIPVWLTIDPRTDALVDAGVWFAYEDVLVKISDASSVGRVVIQTLRCPSPFFLDKNEIHFAELYAKLSAATGSAVYLAAHPASNVHDVIVAKSPPDPSPR